FFFSSRRRHTRFSRDWSSDVCSSDLYGAERVLLTLAEGFAARGHDVTLEIPHEGPALDAARRLKGVRVWHSRRPRLPRNAIELRSEERRVGKEGRCRGATQHTKEHRV